jgi:hypothetical protein
MEITSVQASFTKVKEIFLKEPMVFTNKRDFNWKKVRIIVATVMVLILIAVLFWPTYKPEEKNFHEKTESGTVIPSAAENDPSQATLKQFQDSNVNTASVHSSLDYLYRENSNGSGSAKSTSADRNGTMILSRGGTDSRTQLPPGTRFLVRLIEKTVVANVAMPITGIVFKDVTQENDIAIAQGAKLIGDISFDESNERAHINWKSIIMPDGRVRLLSGISVGHDGQVGIGGNVKSETIKNIVGKTLTRFIGAYAEGSMSKGQLGASEGGSQNGMKNAIAETAKDRANAWAEDMSKEKKWIELQMGTEFYTVLNQPFLFRDPGVTYGK